MHSALQNIINELDQLAVAVNSTIPSDEPFSIAQGNWSFPGISKAELAEAATDLANLIRERGGDDLLDGDEKRINDYIRRLAFLRTHTIGNIWSNASTGVPAYLATLDALRRAVAPTLESDAAVAARATQAAAKVLRRVRAMEARLNEFEPRSLNLAEMVERIEQAHDAADQLPADLEQLAEDRARIQLLLKVSEVDQAAVRATRESADKLDQKLAASVKEAEAVLERCESAYSAATSQGLAAAFAERSTALSYSMWAWVVGLIVALALGASFGSQRLHALSELMKTPSLTTGTAVLNLLLAALSVGAPIWFSWLATKQIGQRFKLSEDYAFKAAVSRAYEGYRKEAARIDKDMETKLLASALTRIDEQPLRFVDHDSHGSPWHELASSDLIKSAMKLVPGYAESVTSHAKDLAKNALNALKPRPPAMMEPSKPIIATDATSPPN